MLDVPLSFGSTMRSGHGLGGWRCRLNLCMFLLTISVGRIWSVKFVLEFSAIQKNLRIMSDIEKVLWTVLFGMASRVFLFFTPSDSNLAKNWFVCREPVLHDSLCLRWFINPNRELYLSFFSCSFFSAQSSFVSMALVYSKNTYNFFPLSRLGRLVFGL